MNLLADDLCRATEEFRSMWRVGLAGLLNSIALTATKQISGNAMVNYLNSDLIGIVLGTFSPHMPRVLIASDCNP
jgi:hypothetical protein